MLNIWGQTRRTFQVILSATRWHLRSSREDMVPIHLSLIHLQTHGQSILYQPGQSWNLPTVQPPAEASQPREDRHIPYEGCTHVSSRIHSETSFKWSLINSMLIAWENSALVSFFIQSLSCFQLSHMIFPTVGGPVCTPTWGEVSTHLHSCLWL